MRQKQGVFSLFLLSPSSRRAWIEIGLSGSSGQPDLVALLAEGVDRNKEMRGTAYQDTGRPPRGGRG